MSALSGEELRGAREIEGLFVIASGDIEKALGGSSPDAESSLAFLERLEAGLTDLSAMEQALEATVRHFKASSGILLLTNPSPPQAEFQTVASCGESGPAGWEDRAREAASGSEVVLFDPWQERSATANGNSALGLVVPLRTQGEPSGLLAMLRADQTNEFTTHEISLARLVGNHISAVFDRTRRDQELDDARETAHRAELQLERFALDIRQTFEAEKARANELAAALDELQQTYRATVQGLAIAVEAKDAYTAGHIHRVTQYGLAMMRLVAPELADDRQFEYGFLLHDVGKLAVPDAILKKEGPLNDEEWVLMREHADTGHRILEAIPFLRVAKEIVRCHHERWDGKGYPRGLKGDQIPIGARVFPVADSFDAMTSDRPYRKGMPTRDALDEIRRGKGSQFWPEAVDAFLSISIDRLEEVRYGSTQGDPRGG